MGQHPGVDQLIQHTDGQRRDVLGAQVVQNQQVSLLAGGQPFLIVGVVKVLLAQLGGQCGGTGVQHIMSAFQYGICNRQRQMCLAQAAVAHEQQIRAVGAEPGRVVLTVIQQLAHVFPRGNAQLRLHIGAVPLHLKARKLA